MRLKEAAPGYEVIEEVAKNIDCIVEVEKFNPYHGPDGRFSSSSGLGGVSVAVGVGGGTATGSKRTAVAGTLRDVEKANKDLDHEVATIVDPNTGKVIFAKEGGAAGVSFNSSESKEIARKVLTHNHPDEVIFSPSDVAMAYHVSTIRATTRSGKVFDLSGLNTPDAVRGYNEHYMSAREKSLKRLGVDPMTLDRNLTPAQRKSSFAEITESCNKWLSDNAAKYGYQYSVGRIE